MWNETVHGRWYWWQVPPLQENVTFAGVEPGDLLYDYFYDQDGSLRFFFGSKEGQRRKHKRFMVKNIM